MTTIISSQRHLDDNIISIAEILALAAKLPAGLPDPDALKKLTREMDEFNEAIEANDTDGALTEVADVVYYAAKAMHHAASVMGIDVETAMRLAIAKYRLRARPGNPKNDAAERAACRAVLLEARGTLSQRASQPVTV